MANAMLEEDFKSSHPDLVSFEVAESRKVSSGNSSSSSNNNSNKMPATNTNSSPEKVRSLTTRKSVEFMIDPPSAKRSRPSVPWTAKQVVNAISTSITRKERMEAIQKAKDAFNHDLAAIHDDEMASGADAALVKHLTFLAFHAQLQQDDQETLELILAEISLTCDTLESLFRASSQAVGASLQRMGQELMQLLVGVIDNELSRRRRLAASKSDWQEDEEPKRPWYRLKQEDHDSGCTPDLEDRASEDSYSAITSPDPIDTLRTAEGDLLLRKASKLLGHFARVGEATKPMAHFPGLLGILLCLTSLQPYCAVPWEARLSALWTLANLACNSENMQMMACTPGLVESLVQVARRPLDPDCPLERTVELLRSRSIASRAILNLSWCAENKITLAENFALVDLLAELAVLRSAPWSQSRTVRDILLSTRRHAVGALRNLAAAPRRTKLVLCEYKKGHLFDVLADAVLNDDDIEVKDRSFAAIHNLTIHDIAERIVNHPTLVVALQNAMLSDDVPAEPESGSTLKSHASAILLVLERTITPEMDGYDSLRKLVDAVHPSPSTASMLDSGTSEDFDPVNATAV